MIIIRKTNPGSFFTQIEELVVNFILPLLLVFVSLGLLNFYVRPSTGKISDIKNEIAIKNSQNFLLNAKLSQLKNLKENESLMIKDLSKMSWILDERSNAPRFTRQIVLMSNDANVVFKSLDYTSPVVTSPRVSVVGLSNVNESAQTGQASLEDLYREESVNVVLESSSVEDFVKFLDISENSIKLIKVNNINLTLNRDVIRTNINMSSPYLNPSFKSYLQTASPIDLNDTSYRSFLSKMDGFRNYAEEISLSVE